MQGGLTQFVDMHCHILPGIDDGPESYKQSINMALAYTKVGISRVIATPHFIPGTAWCVNAKTVLDKVSTLNALYREQGIGLNVYPGMEIAYHHKVYENIYLGRVLPLGDSRSYLVEPPFNQAQGPFVRCMRRLLDSGYSIVIAHPERMQSFLCNPGSLFSLAAQGVRIQMNMGSLLGKYGSECRQLSQEILDRRLIYSIASDAHGATRRKPPTAKEWQELERILGEETLVTLAITNPLQLLTTTTTTHHENPTGTEFTGRPSSTCDRRPEPTAPAYCRGAGGCP